MTPQTRVPSRALIHALRGILFTTSCSVVILAEERRRRLKLARTALDNARKLHTAKTRRRSVQLIEDRGPYDYVDPFTLTTSAKHTLDRGSRRGNESLELSPSEEPKLPPPAQPTYSISSQGYLSPPPSDKDFFDFTIPRAICERGVPSITSAVWKPATTPIRGMDRTISAEHSGPLEVTEGSTTYDDEKIQTLLEAIASPECSRSDALEAIASIFNMLSSLKEGIIIPRKLWRRSPQILQALMEHDQSKIETLISILLSRCKDTLLRLLKPMVVDLVEADRPDIFVRMMKVAFQERKREFGGFHILRIMLAQYRRSGASFEKQERLFQMIQQAGYFTGRRVERSTEFLARRDMLFAAREAGNSAFIKSEMQQLVKLDAERVASDVQLQGLAVQDKARRGDWDAVFADVAGLAQVPSCQGQQLHELLYALVETFMEQRSLEEVEVLLRSFARQYKMALDCQWTLRVMERYASHGDIDGACSWLQFCAESGLEMDAKFLNKFYRNCHQTWKLSPASLQLLDKGLRAAIPTLPAGWRGWRPGTVVDTWRGVATRMKDHMHKRHWEQAWSLYDESRVTISEFSPACFRLAIQCRVKLDGGNTDTATTLVKEAMEKGLEVSKAMKDLMLGKIAGGADAHELLNHSLSLNIPVDDDVYNKSAQALLAAGNFPAAERVCKLAARENGKQDLVYNEHNFANLLFIYSVRTRYEEVVSMVHTFTSKRQPWHGSPRCKEGVKYAMKIIAQRAVAQPKQAAVHERALRVLDQAFMHVKESRVNGEDRRQLQETLQSMVLSVPEPKLGRRDSDRQSAGKEKATKGGNGFSVRHEGRKAGRSGEPHAAGRCDIAAEGVA